MRRFLFAMPLLASLAACTMVPYYHRPALPVANQYPAGPVSLAAEPGNTVSPISAADMGWQDFFGDPILRDLIGFSLEHNRDLRVAALNTQAAEAQYRIQHANLFPTIDATAGGDFERIPPGESGFGQALHVNAYTLGLGTTNYELDLFGRIRSLSEQARETYLAAADTRINVRISLIAQVAASYLAWRADQEALIVAQDTAVAQGKNYELRKLTLDQGSGTGLDVAQAETTLRTAQASVQQYKRQAAQDMDQIVLLAGAPLPAALQDRVVSQEGVSATPAFPDLPAGLPSDLLQRRPDIRAAEHTLKAANANVGAARAAFFPSLTITGSGGTASGSLGALFGPGSLSWLFQPQFSVPIFDAGANFAKLDYAKVQKRIEIADYEKTIQTAFRDVADALAARGTYQRQVEAEQKLVQADQRYYTISKMRADAGVDTYLNVLVAQNSLLSAQLTLISLKLSEQQNLVTLYKVLGGGWRDTSNNAMPGTRF